MLFLLRFSLLSLLFFSACKKDEKEIVEFIPNVGQVQVLNGCGIPGAAETMRNFLAEIGFDIVEFGNAPSWNYKKTIIIARTDSLQVAKDLATILKTENWVQIIDSARMVSATIIVGKDFYQRIYGKSTNKTTTRP